RYLNTWTFGGLTRSYSDRFRGFSLFVSKINKYWKESFRFATLLSDSLFRRGLYYSPHHAENIPGEGRILLDSDRGIYQYDNLVILREVAAPAVLVEAGVIVNRDEEPVIDSDERRQLIGEAMADATDAFCVENADTTLLPR